MSLYEVALQLTLEAMREGNYHVDGDSNTAIGEKIAELYNTIYRKITE